MTNIDIHPFWGKKSPLAHVSFIPFLLCASVRLSVAIMSSAALMWTYVLSSVTILVTARIIPATFKSIMYVFISSFWTLVFSVFIYLFSPVLFYEIQFPLAFTAIIFTFSSLGENVEIQSFSIAMKNAVVKALIVSFCILIFSLFREPFGFGALSLPTKEGISEILTSNTAHDLAIRSVAATSGGLILLGFIVGFYRIAKDMFITYYSQKESK